MSEERPRVEIDYAGPKTDPNAFWGLSAGAFSAYAFLLAVLCILFLQILGDRADVLSVAISWIGVVVSVLAGIVLGLVGLDSRGWKRIVMACVGLVLNLIAAGLILYGLSTITI